MLKPSFLPDEEQAAAASSAPSVDAGAPAPPAAPATPVDRPTDRLGEAIQLIYSEESAFRTQGGEGLTSKPPAVVERDTSLL